MVLRYVRAGADLVAGDWLNDTPLHTAVTFGHKELVFEIVRLAQEQKRLYSVVSARSVDGLTAYDMALKWGYDVYV